MCDSGCPVGIRSTIRFVRGSITVTVLVSSVVTYSRPSGPKSGQCGLSGRPKSTVATRLREPMSMTSSVCPSVPGRPTPEFP